jgi:type IV secretory pathway VirB4 component
MFSLIKIKKSSDTPFKVPKSIQQFIPVDQVWQDGIFRSESRFSKSWKIADINYAVASKDDQTELFLGYSELLNSLDAGATTQITINNRRLNRQDFEKTILIPAKPDGLNTYRDEYNAMLEEKAITANNNLVQEKIITISIVKKDIEEARSYFNRLSAELQHHLTGLSSSLSELNATERLRIQHDFFRIGEETYYRFNLAETLHKGHSFKDFICPDCLEFKKDHFMMGNRFGRVLFLREYASYIKDSLITELCELNRNLMLSIDINPVPTDEAVRMVQNKLLGVETNITNWQRKQNENQNYSAVVPFQHEQERKEVKEFLDDLTTRDQRMILALVTMVHIADSKEQLDSDTESLLAVAQKHLCQFATLNWQQPEGLNTAMPYGLQYVHALRTMTTESTAVLMPFKTQEILQPGGTYYGQNTISRNMIVVNRRKLLNGNGFILGVSGSGKSFAAKREICDIALSTDDDILIVDPEREYSPLIKGLGGEVIRIAAGSKNHINAMDINANYGGDTENPIVLKAEFILSLCEQLVGAGKLTAKEKSIIDRCTANVYRGYLQRNFETKPPTLEQFHAELLRQEEPEAREVALAIELFTKGSLNTFARPTNVDIDNRFIVYDIKDLGRQLKTVGMLVVLDAIFNRITRNNNQGKNTWLVIDEIYLLFANEYSANFLFEMWKRVRKYGAFCTGITQNVEDLLQSHTARTMLSNSEFLLMLNQAGSDRLELAKLLNISDTQLSYITNAEAGKGLLKCAGNIVPFEDKFPVQTKLYSLMTTKPDEREGWIKV